MYIYANVYVQESIKNFPNTMVGKVLMIYPTYIFLHGFTA